MQFLIERRNKVKKKLISLLLTLILALSCVTVSNASAVDEAKSTVLTLETNRITDVGNRHIKVKWDKVSGARAYKLEIADNENFENATSTLSKKVTQLYWNFAEVPGDVKDTYYIRIQPCFVYSDNEYVYGQWSNVIVAEYKELVIESETLEKIDYFSWIPKGINWEKLLNVDWSKINFGFNLGHIK